MDACTVTTLDVITAFAVPNLNCPSQDQSIFSGLAASRVAPLCLSPSLLRTGNDLFLPTLSTVDESHIKVLLHTCQCSFRRNQKNSVNDFVEKVGESKIVSQVNHGVGDGNRTRNIRSHSPVLCRLSYSHHDFKIISTDAISRQATPTNRQSDFARSLNPEIA